MHELGRMKQANVGNIVMKFTAVFVWFVLAGVALGEPSKTQNAFRVKYILADAVYIDGGKPSGLAEGQRLIIRRKAASQSAEDSELIAEVVIESVAVTSAVGKVVLLKSEIVPGDMAWLPEQDEENRKTGPASQETKGRDQVAGLTKPAPAKQEIRGGITRPPLMEINRVRGRFTTDFSTLQGPESASSYMQTGFTLRLDATRLGGSYWKISGYHRARFQSRKPAASEETLTDLINRTYQLSVTYDNPNSSWVAGAGRLYVPWAASLSTIDGFYLGRRIGKSILGVFGGTTPNPSSWNYSPDRQMGGVSVNFELGSFESVRFSSTSGVALSRIRWQPDRQFGFFENSLFYKRYLSIYSNVEADLLNNFQNSGQRRLVLSRSYFSLRLQPHEVISFNVNHNYFRNIPTFDTRLIGTGLVDKFLFQGFSGGFRLKLPYRLAVYGSAGRSSRTNDIRPSWNYSYGAAAADILRSGIKLDFRISKFDSSFGNGRYHSLFVSRGIGERFRFEVRAGQQKLASALTNQKRSRFINGHLDWLPGDRYFLGFGISVYRGQVQNYNQYFISFGYRFDNRRRRINE